MDSMGQQWWRVARAYEGEHKGEESKKMRSGSLAFLRAHPR